jgi:hypothetical protein
MTSQHKITANRWNSLRSSGPRTADGKRKASGNSCKHGWAALERRLPAASSEVEELAKVLCCDAQDPTLLAQARIIAANELMRRAIRLEKIRTIEMRDEYQAIELAAANLDRLERYDTRAWSRQRRAIRSFIELSRAT